MTHPFTDPGHRVIIVDLEPQLTELQSVIGDYCDEWSLVGELNLLLTTINLLGTSQAVEEAVEAMEIHVHSFCQNIEVPYNAQRLRTAIRVYMVEIHRLFNQCNMYGPDDRLAYEFAGWQGHGSFHALFAPYPYIHQYPNARSGVVAGEPFSNNPQELFPSIYDPHFSDRMYQLALRDKDFVPY